jgi:hypothetical protein
MSDVMTNKEWTELIAKEFNCSNTMAKGMFHAMLQARKILLVSKDVRKERAEEEKRMERQFAEWEESDREAYEFMNAKWYMDLLTM